MRKLSEMDNNVYTPQLMDIILPSDVIQLDSFRTSQTAAMGKKFDDPNLPGPQQPNTATSAAPQEVIDPIIL